MAKGPARVPGLTRRGRRAYYHRNLPAAVGGERIYKSLEEEWGSAEAVERAGAVHVLWQRGDWPIIRRWAGGELHISELVRAVREGDYSRLQRVNVDGYLLGRAVEEFIARAEATRRPNTIRNAVTLCDALLEHFGADRAMHTVTTPEAEAFLHAPKESTGGEPWAAATQAGHRGIAGSLWRYVMEREAEDAELSGGVPTVTRNPWTKARTRKPPRVRPPVLTPEEIRDVLSNPDTWGTPRAAYIGCGAYAGLRQSETANLRTTEDIEIWPEGEWTATEAGVIRIQNRKGEGEWYTKTDRSERDVPMIPELARLILDHMRRGYAGRRYLFRAPGRDSPIHQTTSDAWTRRAFEAAGIQYGRDSGDGLTYHHLRHSFATLLLSEGVSIAAVADLLGNTQKIVLSTYSHALPNDRERALRILVDAAGEEGAE